MKRSEQNFKFKNYIKEKCQYVQLLSCFNCNDRGLRLNRSASVCFDERRKPIFSLEEWQMKTVVLLLRIRYSGSQD